MSDVYDKEPGDDSPPPGLGHRSENAPDFEPPTYDADPETAAAEEGYAPESGNIGGTAANELASLGKSGSAKDGGFVKGGLDKLSNTKAGKALSFLGGNKVKAAAVGIAGILAFIVVLTLFTLNLPAASIRAAGNGLVDMYFGASIIKNTWHLDVYADRVLSKVRTVGLTEACTASGCIAEQSLKGTKLGKYSFTLKQRIVKTNQKMGISILTDGKGSYTGLKIDTTNKKSSYYQEGGSSADELAATLKEKGVEKISIKELQKGVFSVSDEGITKLGSSKLFSTVVRDSKFLPDVLTKATGVRSLGKSLGLGFHPLRALRKVSDWEKVKTQAIAEWLDNRNRAITNGTASDDISVSGKRTTQDANGNTVEEPIEQKATRSGFKDTLTNVQDVANSGAGKAGMTVTGAALLVQGGLCMVRAYYTAKEGVITEANIPTAMRASNDYMAAAEQTQAIDSPEVDSEGVEAYVSNVLEKRNDDGTVDSFSDSFEYGNLNGTQAGVAPTSDIDLMMGKTSSVNPKMQAVYNFAMGDVGKTMCEGVGGLLTMGVGIALTVVSDGVLVAAGGAVVGAVIGIGVSELGNLMGKTLNPANYGPAQNYNIAGMGAAYLAASSQWSSGGSFVSSSAQAHYRQLYSEQKNANFASKNIAYKLFNMQDTMSLTSRLAVKNSTNLNSNLATMAKQLTSGSFIASSVSNILTRKAYAADRYDPCAQTMGGCVNLSDSVMNDDATGAAAVLNGTDGQKYVDLLKECRDISFSKDAEGDWTSSVTGYSSYMRAITGKAEDKCKDIEKDPNVIPLLSYANIEPMIALQLCMTAEENSTETIDQAACAEAGYGADSGSSVVATETSTNSGSSGFQLPLADDIAKKVTVSNCYKSGHAGMDFPVPIGTNVLAVLDGKVVEETSSGDTGNGLLLKVSDGHFVSYQHLQKKLVKTGDNVTKGQVIGQSGNTGYSFGPHLHLTVANTQTWGTRTNISLTLDPRDFLPKTGITYACN